MGPPAPRKKKSVHVKLSRRFTFEAAHRNPLGNEKQQRLHGHSYRMDIVVDGEVESDYGWLIDFADIKARVGPVYREIDHADLNTLEGLDDSRIPMLRQWLLDRLAPTLPGLTDIRLTIAGDCAFAPALLPPSEAEGLPERWTFTFEAAQSLPQLPEDHPCQRLHGHSYRITVGAAEMEPLRPALGRLYEGLDHTCLNDTPGLEGATCEHICGWVWARLAKEGHALTVVIVQETESARCIYHGK